MERKLRILVNTNAPWANSGYAQQARQFLPAMVKAGFPTACVSFHGLEGGLINLDGIMFYPRMGSIWGDDAMLTHGKHFNSDVTFTLQDIWTLNIDTFKRLDAEGRRWVPIIPIDHEPIPPAIQERLRMAYRIVTYSPFGYRELKRIGMHSTYIPHTVQTDIYKKCDKAEIRKQLSIPNDIFLYGIVGANKDNPPRKGFQYLLDAFAKVHGKHPDTGIYFHTPLSQEGGFPIEQYAKSLDIADALFAVRDYDHRYHIQPHDMAKVYSAMDTFVLPSTNEGFGVPFVEAQACEVPVIATDFTAMRDLVIDGKTGFKIRVADKRYTPLSSYVAVPDTQHLYELMDKMYGMSTGEREEMGREARKFVVDNFDFELVWNTKWMPFLNMLEKEVNDSS